MPPANLFPGKGLRYPFDWNWAPGPPHLDHCFLIRVPWNKCINIVKFWNAAKNSMCKSKDWKNALLCLYKTCSKKRQNFCYKDFILQHFKLYPLQSGPLYWRYTVPNVSSIVEMLPGTHFLWWRAVLLSHSPESPHVKKNNFLNSAPTSKEGALRLLSAPSGRFWQQTAICPVSLWALVVELHPMNWARAQAVRRINPTSGGCSSTTNAHSETGQMAICYQNLPLGAISSRSAHSVLVGALFKTFGFFFNRSISINAFWLFRSMKLHIKISDYSVSSQIQLAYYISRRCLLLYTFFLKHVKICLVPTCSVVGDGSCVGFIVLIFTTQRDWSA
jgi:hypothetical protein